MTSRDKQAGYISSRGPGSTELFPRYCPPERHLQGASSCPAPIMSQVGGPRVGCVGTKGSQGGDLDTVIFGSCLELRSKDKQEAL